MQPLWKVVWRFLRKLKAELPCDPAIPLLSIYPKEIVARGWRKREWGDVSQRVQTSGFARKISSDVQHGDYD